MNASEIRKKYLEFFKHRGHAIIPRANLVPQEDATTLFTGSGMQPLIPYLLGAEHPQGKRLCNSQTSLRAEDIEEVGDNRHTTFFEMLGNWSLGDYFKKEQINWFWEFLTEEIQLKPERIFVSCFIGDEAAGIPKDSESAAVWSDIFKRANIDPKQIDIGTESNGYAKGEQAGRIFFYGEKNWWCRAGKAKNMPPGEPGGPDTEMFYLFPEIPHDLTYGKHCHVNCDCGRYIELGNSVFMEYLKTDKGFQKLPKQNVDYGGGLERIAAAAIDSPDVFRISLLWPIVNKLEELSNKKYEDQTHAMRVVADHLRGAAFLAIDGVVPSNNQQGYVMRRLMRRAIRYGLELGIAQDFSAKLVPSVVSLYEADFPEVAERKNLIIDVFNKEEKIFRQTLRKGVKEFNKMTANGSLKGEHVFKLYDTYGFPTELSIEEAGINNIKVDTNWLPDFERLMTEQKTRSRTATQGQFKGGLGGHSKMHKKYHTATHLMYKALRQVLGDHVTQRGSNITEERLRFDFSHPEKVTTGQITQIEKIVNDAINKDYPMGWKEMNTKEALSAGVLGAFGDKYGESVKVYTAGDPDGEWFSQEICGGPHVDHTIQLAEGSKKFKIIKEEASSSGIRRIKAILE